MLLRDVRSYLIGSVFVVLCQQRGLLPLHASAVTARRVSWRSWEIRGKENPLSLHISLSAATLWLPMTSA